MRARQLDLPLTKDGPGARPERARNLARAEEASPFEVPLPEGESLRGLPPKRVIVERATALAATLSKGLSKPVRLFVTDNCSTMISFRRVRDLLTLRVHHMFLDAPQEVVEAIAEYAGRGGKHAAAVIDGFVRKNSEAIRAGVERAAPRLSARGQVYDLQPMFDRLNERFFEDEIDARIGWGRGVPWRRRRTIRMGVYDHLSRTIRIHPALDRAEVPEFFVEYIVFHEMLHQAIPGKERGERRQHHSPEFRAREKKYPGYARALEWEKANLALLLGRARGRAPAID